MNKKKTCSWQIVTLTIGVIDNKGIEILKDLKMFQGSQQRLFQALCFSNWTSGFPIFRLGNT
jgi:hypothetical protein